MSGNQPAAAADTSISGSGGSSAAAQSPFSSTGGFTAFNENATTGNLPTNTGTGQTTTTSATRVYVLESDITQTQNKVRVLEDNASFG
jgi:hypothetical protein